MKEKLQNLVKQKFYSIRRQYNKSPKVFDDPNGLFYSNSILQDNEKREKAWREFLVKNKIKMLPFEPGVDLTSIHAQIEQKNQSFIVHNPSQHGYLEVPIEFAKTAVVLGYMP